VARGRGERVARGAREGGGGVGAQFGEPPWIVGPQRVGEALENAGRGIAGPQAFGRAAPAVWGEPGQRDELEKIGHGRTSAGAAGHTTNCSRRAGVARGSTSLTRKNRTA